MNAYIEDRGRRGGRPDRRRRRLQPAARRSSTGRRRAGRDAEPVRDADVAVAHAVHRSIGERRVSAVVHGATATEPGSCPQAARRPGASCPARRSPSRRAGSTSPMTPMIYALFPDTPANEAEFARSEGHRPEHRHAATVENNMFAICDATGLSQGATAAEVVDAAGGQRQRSPRPSRST